MYVHVELSVEQEMNQTGRAGNIDEFVRFVLPNSSGTIERLGGRC